MAARPATSQLPKHLKNSVDSTSEIDERSDEQATAPQLAIERLTDALGRPVTLYVVLVVVAGWLAVNLVLSRTGHPAPDPFPFHALQGAITLSALLMTILILTTERRLGELADRRAKLALQLNLITEQKVTKLIELSGKPLDPEAKAMKKSADPKALLDALEDENHQAGRGRSR